MSRRFSALLLPAAAWTGAALCLLLPRAEATDAKTHVIVIDAMQFRAQSLRVRSGDQIVWINKDLFPHTVTDDGKAFDSGNLAPNASWTFVPGSPGRYAYHCAFHPPMTGELIVE